jgi:glucosamine--fructose-6-phosphate aminotransferase (isomerizing)
VPARSRFETDIEDQPDALRSFASNPLPSEVHKIDLDRYERVVITGMGASHFAGQPTWRSLANDGRPVWWVTTAQLLATPGLVTRDTLLWVTSQSGESGEVVALAGGLGPATRPRTLLAVTNDPGSQLAAAADVVVPLHFGSESAVSTKSYVTTLAAHERLLACLQGQDDAATVARIGAVAEELGRFSPDLAPVAASATSGVRPRLVFVASPPELASALVGALLLKEVAKFPAEGFLAGEFRHGPLELAGAGLTMIVYGSGEPDASLTALTEQVAHSGALVVQVDAGPGPALTAWVFTTACAGAFGRLVCEAKFSQLLSAQLARVLGVEPGEFRFGSKVTETL